MKVYIKSTGAFYPEKDPESGVFKTPKPLIKEFVDPKESRRMSKIIKSGIYSGMTALKKCGISTPGAIITGTGLGCLGDTVKFISSIIQFNEENLNPAPFIYSTHNSIGGQISIITGCKGYNSTFVHRGISFESALFEAFLMIKEESASNILVGGADELTDEYLKITGRMELYKENCCPGEGSGFMVVSGEKDGSLAELTDIKLVPSFDRLKVEKCLNTFIEKNSIIPQNTLLFAPFNGDSICDGWKESILSRFNWKKIIVPKENSGEFMTAGAISSVKAAETMMEQEADNILLWNSFLNMESAFIFMRKA
jgi:3-oxoacyl-[acyl-carrier-protein] synthase II